MTSTGDTNLNGFSFSKPDGILGKALHTNRKVVFLCHGLFLLLDAIVSIIGVQVSPRLNTYYNAIYFISQMFFGISIFLLYRKRKKFIDCFNHFGIAAKIDTICPSLPGYLRKSRLFILLYIFLVDVFYAIICIVIFVENFSNSDKNVELFLSLGSVVTGLLGYFVFLQFFVESCLYVQSCFMQVEYQITSLNISNSSLNIYGIRQVRRLYCFAVETTEMLNSLISPVIAVYFFVCFSQTHISFASTIDEPSLINISVFIAESSTFVIVMYHIIYIHHLSIAIHDKVYSLSYKADSLIAKKEVQLFLTRIARADVGYTFLGLFVITPTCVTSLTTISLTIALAAPTFIK